MLESSAPSYVVYLVLRHCSRLLFHCFCACLDGLRNFLDVLAKLFVLFFLLRRLSFARFLQLVRILQDRLFRLLFSLGSERHATRRRQRRRRKRKTLRFVVVIPVAFFFSSHEKRRNFCCLYRERGNFFARRVSQTYISSERSNRNFCAQIRI